MAEREAPVITVIIPTYNMAEYVGAAVDSVLAGTFESVEVIVVDDGSTDETEDVVSRYTAPTEVKYDERVQYVFQSNQGKAAAVNHGLSLAEGAYVTILDADDTLPVDSLSTRYQHRQDRFGRQCDLVIGGFEVFDEKGIRGIRLPPETHDPATLRRRFYLHFRAPFSLSACLIARDLVNRTGAMDEHFQRCQDIDYAVRLLDVADRLSILQSVVYQYRKHRTSTFERMRTRVKTTQNRARVIWKNYYGWRKWVGVPLGILIDAGKLGYELVLANYKK